MSDNGHGEYNDSIFVENINLPSSELREKLFRVNGFISDEMKKPTFADDAKQAVFLMPAMITFRIILTILYGRGE